ncbi:radical SAM family heme chaperone HemW [Geobacter sp. SVR]|uniref:radical SAM family heme chaperone HemW n=1 Tax=Geobacter sp. SVR TaxID=2495594 RepID=UPI00143F01AC|nr:radical SAM family heme chaperone HemW [Geobacter sp. SVR]BCS52976.1 coproporphyrinogen III oxidase [Geobacter sp. SVR]GCF84360.1 coproporphyrinogen III oxidase [Geobacter sp. SVR]
MFTRIYVHIPFCRSKCPYCAFVSSQGREGEIDDYVALLLKEMQAVRKKVATAGPLDSVYFGGGTPSLLPPSQVAALLERVNGLFDLKDDAEITLEANPATIDDRCLKAFRTAGINRLSIGVQSFDPRMLALLGRIHSPAQAVDAITSARRAGFGNIGIDLIHALPGQTPAMWRLDLEQALRMAPEHISVYGLSIEEGTPFAERYADDSPLPDQDLAADMFEEADTLLTAGGYDHYEIANYARPGFRSRHNSGYWHRDGYLGLGAGAHSFLRDSACGTRFGNVPDLEGYAAALDRNDLPRCDVSKLSRQEAMAEFMYLGLRLAEGIRFAAFEKEFGQSPVTLYGEIFQKLSKAGLMEADHCSVRLTRKGMLLSNRVFAMFLP